MDEVLFNALVSYFNTVKIKISPSELKLQLFSHPHTPSLYAISETLNFLKIENIAAEVEHEQLEFLPNNFIAFLRDEEGAEYFTHVRKSKNSIFLNNTKNSISKEEFFMRWDGVVLVAEQKHTNQVVTYFWSKGIFLLLAITLILFLWPKIYPLLFCFIGIVGLILSEEIFKTTNNMESPLGEKICGKEKKSGCNTILNSSKYKVSLFSFNDLLFSFFISNLVFTLLNVGFNNFHMIVYAIAIAAVLTTVFIQKFIAKAWCFLCLLSSACIVLQAIIIFTNTFFWETSFIFDSLETALKSASIFILLFFISLFTIYNFRKLRKQNYELTANEINLLRFKRSPEIISLVVTNSKHIDFVKGADLLECQNKGTKHVIRLVLSTSCGFCKNAFTMFYRFYQENKIQYSFQIIFNHYEVGNSKRNRVAANLIQVYQKEGFYSLLKKLDGWFNNPKANANLEEYSGHIGDENYAVLLKQRDWSKNNGLFHTPILIIDTIIIPEFYDTSFLSDFLKTIEENESKTNTILD